MFTTPIMNVFKSASRRAFPAGGNKPSVLSGQNAWTFGAEAGYAIRLIAQEKEIIVLSALQVLNIYVGCLFFIEAFQWLPDGFFQTLREAEKNDVAYVPDTLDLYLALHNSAIVAALCVPAAILNAAVVSTHLHRTANQNATLIKSLFHGCMNLPKLWLFTFLDAKFTLSIMMQRLPSSERRKNKIANELLYYTWKIGSAGMLPALVSGYGLIKSAKLSAILLMEYPQRVIGIRLGYSLICWIIAILSYAACILYLIHLEYQVDYNKVFELSLIALFPAICAVAAIFIIVRPIFLICMAKVYTDVLYDEADQISVNVGMGKLIAATTMILMWAVAMICLANPEWFGIPSLIEDAARAKMRALQSAI